MFTKSAGFGVMENLTWYQSLGIRFNSFELRRRWGVGVSGTSTWYNYRTSCKDGVCSGCVLEKHHQDSFDKRASWHASVPLELVHSDLCGPLPSASFSGFKYFLTFIDDYSRCTWVYFLKLKSELSNIFLAYKALVEKTIWSSNY